MKPLREQTDPTARFSERVEAYERYRPGYPAEAIDAILDGLAAPIVAADIGAGTGISARLLADRGLEVHAIEPNEAMREAGIMGSEFTQSPEAGRDARPAGRKNIIWHDATGERTGLTDHSVSLVLCAQAYHWLDPEGAATEFIRILAPGGRIALMWNDWNEASPVAAGYAALIRKHVSTLPEHHDSTEPTLSGRLMLQSTHRFEHAQRLDLEGLIGRAMSASYVPREGPAHDAIVRGLTALHAEHKDDEGLIDLGLEALVFFVNP